MKLGQAFYEWKVKGKDGELYTPHGDPMQHEFPFDFQFASVEEAHQGLIDWGATDEYYEGDDDTPPKDWKPDGWVLVKTVSEIVEQ